MLLICLVLLTVTWICRVYSVVLWSGLSYFRILTICLLLVYFVSAAGCHCFDLVIPCSTLCRPSVDSLHNLSEAGNSFQESHRKEMSEFNSLIQVVSYAEILCWSFLERINYFSFDLCV